MRRHVTTRHHTPFCNIRELHASLELDEPQRPLIAIPIGVNQRLEVVRGESTTTESLVRAAQRGDRDAFTLLYDYHVRFVHTLLLAYAAPDEVPDLVQEVFLTAWRQLSALRDFSAFSGWLGSISRNAGRMHLRARRDYVPLSNELQSSDAQPESALDAERALNLIATLPENQREPLLLRLVDGMNGEEIARHLQMSHAAVRVNLHRGMKRLRELMESPDV